ncbi:MAG: hypothetical protein ACLFQX_13515, partial [Candidatus Kapaibacterium sp.]
MNLSKRAQNVCQANKMQTLNDLIEFYRMNSSFYSLRNCGKKTNDELVNIIKEYGIKSEPSRNLSTEEYISDIPDLSQELKDICIQNRLFTVRFLKEYYLVNKSFIDLDHFNPVKSKQLTDFLLKRFPNLDNCECTPNEIELPEENMELSPEHTNAIKIFSKHSFELLPLRTKKVLSCIDENIDNAGLQIIDYPIEDVLSYRNAGLATKNQILDYVANIRLFAKSLMKLDKLHAYKITLLLEQLILLFNIPETHANQLYHDLSKKRKFDLFEFLGFLVY